MSWTETQRAAVRREVDHLSALALNAVDGLSEAFRRQAEEFRQVAAMQPDALEAGTITVEQAEANLEKVARGLKNDLLTAGRQAARRQVEFSEMAIASVLRVAIGLLA